MIIDLHNHTTPRSSCSVMKPDDLVEFAKRAGLDGLCITEHDRIWKADELKALSEKHEFPLFRGMEVSTDLGHVLVFGLEEYVVGSWKLSTLAEAVTEAGGFMILTHPARSVYSYANTLEEYVQKALQYVHTIEVFNGGRMAPENDRVAKVAEDMRLKGTGASDAHQRMEVGRCATIFERPVSSEAELVAELHSGRFRAADLKREVPEAEAGTASWVMVAR
jgi:predicted metal-dependent phosphoesterase TrpH